MGKLALFLALAIVVKPSEALTLLRSAAPLELEKDQGLNDAEKEDVSETDRRYGDGYKLNSFEMDDIDVSDDENSEETDRGYRLNSVQEDDIDVNDDQTSEENEDDVDVNDGQTSEETDQTGEIMTGDTKNTRGKLRGRGYKLNSVEKDDTNVSGDESSKESDRRYGGEYKMNSNEKDDIDVNDDANSEETDRGRNLSKNLTRIKGGHKRRRPLTVVTNNTQGGRLNG